MDISRRQFITGGSAAAAATAAALGSSFRGAELLEWVARPSVAWAAGRTARMPAPSAEQLLLGRASWGATAAEVARVRAMGIDAWIEEQLAYEKIDDSAVEST